MRTANPRPARALTTLLATALLSTLGAVLGSAPGVARAAPPPVQSRTLPDGLTVLVAENHALPLVTIEIGVKNGAMTESPEYNGLSHLYEHMFFKANSVLPDQLAYMARMRELGMSFNGTTGNERVNYFFTTTTDHFADAMAFMRAAIVSPLFLPEELSREEVVVTGEIDRNEASPLYHFYHEVEKHLWWKFPSRKWALGTREAVLAATPEKMQTIKGRYYVPNNSVLIIVGDVVANDVFAMAEKLYAGWKSGADPFVKFPLVTHPALPRSEAVVVEQPVQSVNLAWSFIGPSALGADQQLGYAADRLSYVLGEPSSKFQKAAVDSGACISAGFGWETARNQGAVRLSAEATPEKADECAKVLMAQLPKMKQADYVSDEELANAVRRATVDKAREREKPSEYAHVLSNAWCTTGLAYYDGYIEGLKSVQRDDIARFMETFVLGKPFVFGALVSKAMREKGLDQPHFEQLVGAAPALAAGSAPVEKPPVKRVSAMKGIKKGGAQ